MPRPKGSKNVLRGNAKQILEDNTGFLINKAIDCINEDPKTYQTLFAKLLDKIAPSLQKNENINQDKDYEIKLKEILDRANQLILIDKKAS
jgi:hypothetical protein